MEENLFLKNKKWLFCQHIVIGDRFQVVEYLSCACVVARGTCLSVELVRLGG